jgi:hypothetical protein
VTRYPKEMTDLIKALRERRCDAPILQEDKRREAYRS